MLRKRIVDSDSNLRIIKMMGSKNARKIIQITDEKPLSASEIHKACSIPLTKVYRWLRKLENCKLLQPSGNVNENGRRVRLYKSQVNMIMIDPRQTSPNVEILGSGIPIKCSKCGSNNCNLTFDKKTNKTVAQCIDCDIKFRESVSHQLKEQEQKFIILESLSNSQALKEEQQKVFLLEGLLQSQKSK